MRPLAAFALSFIAGLALVGCATDGAPTPAAPVPPSSAENGAEPADADAPAQPAAPIGGDVTTGMDWPEGWPVQFPRVGGEIINATSDPGAGTFSVVMYTEESVADQLINALRDQGLTVLHQDVSGTTHSAALSDGQWRVDVIGVIQDDTNRPHLRYMLQQE